MASRKHDSGTSEKARISFLLNRDDDDADRTQPARSSHALAPAQQRSSSRSAKGVIKKRQKNSLCQTCGHSFYSNSQLNNHVRTVHLLHKPFECSICHKKFGEKFNATQHFKAVHERQKNAACDQCDKVFVFRRGLLRHVRSVHEDVRNFHCRHPGCGQSFKLKEHLKRHEEVHSRGGDVRGQYGSS